MNTTQAKAFYKKVDLDKLPSDLRQELEDFDKDTQGFSKMNDQDFDDFKEIKNLIEGVFPKALKKAKGSKAKVGAKKVIKAKVTKAKVTKAKATKRKTTKAATPKKVVAPIKVKTPRVKSTPKPKLVRKVSATKSKTEKAMSAKRAKFDKMEKELKQYKAILKDNDKVKTEIAIAAQTQYNKIVSLGKSKFEVDYKKLEIEHKLFKAFVASDKSKLKSIRVKAVGKVEPSLGRAKRKPSVKPSRKTKKSGIGKFLDKAEKMLFGK